MEPEVDDDKAEEFRDWRVNIAHDVGVARFIGGKAQSLAARVCSGISTCMQIFCVRGHGLCPSADEGGLELSGAHAEMHTQISDYLDSLKRGRFWLVSVCLSGSRK